MAGQALLPFSVKEDLPGPVSVASARALDPVLERRIVGVLLAAGRSEAADLDLAGRVSTRRKLLKSGGSGSFQSRNSEKFLLKGPIIAASEKGKTNFAFRQMSFETSLPRSSARCGSSSSSRRLITAGATSYGMATSMGSLRSSRIE